MKPYIKRQLVCSVVIAALLVTFSGCGRGGQTVEKVFPVSGTVRIDGKPLADGMLSFLPADGKGGSSSSIVENGAFQCSVAAGAKLIKIDDMRTGKSYGGEAASLTAEVKSEGKNHFEFDVSSRSK